MQEIKYCQRCGKQIGNLYESDYYSFIRLKYCSGCKSIVKREQDAKRMKKFREDNRQKNKMIRDELFLQKEKIIVQNAINVINPPSRKFCKI